MRWLLLTLGLVGAGLCAEPVASVIRTQLKVGRNLRPTKTLEVRTKNGDIAKLIVKWRDNRTPYRALSNVRLPKNEHLEGVPNPVEIRSDAIYVKGEASKSKRARNLEVDKDGILVVTGVRVPDDPADRVQVWRNARVINNVLVQGQSAEPSSRPATQTQPEWAKVEPINASPSANWNNSPWRQVSPPQNHQVTEKIVEYIKNINRQEVLSRQKDSYNTLGRRVKDEPKIEARVLHTPSAVVYPTSTLYSPPSQANKVQPAIEEGVRTPVLQYAHPELGVQAALTKPEEEKMDYGRDKGYYPHDILTDRNPYSYEPGLDDQVRTKDYSYNDKRSNSEYTRPKKHLDYFPSQQSYGGYNDKFYSKYGPHKDSYIKYVDLTDRRPFWEKLSDSIREHVEYGVERMSSLARPVVDPLVEATHKISENLGFHMGTRKVGSVGPPTMLLPALGLVAGGAALGLGAVAVGRYLDVDFLSRSQKGLPLATLDPVVEKRVYEATQGLGAVDRVKRDLAHEGQLQDLEHIQRVDSGPSVSPQAWANTPCAKKIFCQVMLSKPHDDVTLMEKKMEAFLRMVEPKVADTVKEHLDDVMQAIRKGSCSQFQCPFKIGPSPR